MNKHSLFTDLVGLAAFASLVYGCLLAWSPLGWIVGGFLGMAYALAVRRPKEPESGENHDI